MKFVFALALVALCVMYMHARPNVVKRGADEQGTQREKRAAADKKRYPPWPSTDIPYHFEPDELATKEKDGKQLKRIIEEAAQEWKEKAGINFYHSDSAKGIAIKDGGLHSGCWSYVGYQSSGENVINLEFPACWTHGVVLHEMGHALGLIHEMKRADRDTYVKVNTENVDPERKNQFTKDDDAKAIDFKTSDELHSKIGIFDYCSIMGYSAKAFSKNGEDTITALGDDKENAAPCLGSQIGLSQRDGMGVAELYGTLADKQTDSSGEPCKYGGYMLNGRDDCECSNLFEDKDLNCDTPKKIGSGDCGQTVFNLESSKTTDFVTPKFKDNKNYPNDQECIWVATCPENSVLCVAFPEGYTLEEPSTSGSCFFDWISFYVDEYETLKGRRYCGNDKEGWYHVLPSHFAAVVFKSDDAYPAKGFDGVFACIEHDKGEELDQESAQELDHKCLELIKKADPETEAIDFQEYQEEYYDMYYYYYYYYYYY